MKIVFNNGAQQLLSSYIILLLLLNILCRTPEPTEEPLLPPSNQQLITTSTTSEASTAVIKNTTNNVKKVKVTTQCFHQPISICHNFTTANGGRCDRVSNEAVVCCNLNSVSLYEHLDSAGVGPTDIIKSLHIINATLDSLNVAHSIWRRLISLSITDGNIKNVTGGFLRIASISCLNLSNNGLVDIEKRALVSLINLSTLDLSHNNLEALPKFDTRDVNLSLDISENKPLLCSNLQDTMGTKKGLIFQNQNRTYCLSSKMFASNWLNSNSTERIPFTNIERLVELSLLCPRIGNKNCTCLPHRFDFYYGKYLLAVKVDCSNRNLTSLPTQLPPYTTFLNVSHNQIESLALLSDDPDYKDVRELFADNNKITSIVKLEGTKFIDNFAILSLKANKLKTLPTYFLSNVFDRLNTRYIFLGKNFFTCDCNTVKVFKVWLITRTKNIPDYDEIWCENLPQKVVDLDQTKVCQYPGDWTDYIYHIIAAEILLLVGLICKVFYDYWIFKTTGYLPWPASKMPKLPCDWLCET